MQLIIQAGDLGPKWFHVALRTLVLLASTKSMLKSHIIAEQLGEDPTFIRKILSRLAKSEYVKSHGGRYGGYSINTLPEEITIKDVYQALGDTSPTPFYTVPSTGVEYFISQIIEKAERCFQEELNEFTIQDLLDRKEKK
ncbi:Rrf2 family transcriptional regulator [Neobacillus sp. K501]